MSESEQEEREWYIGYCIWREGDEMSRDPGNIHDLESLEECRKTAIRLSINSKMGYTFQHITTHGPEGERVDLMKE